MGPRGGGGGEEEEEDRKQVGWTRKPVWTFMEKRKYEGRRRYLNELTQIIYNREG
jgi:hypothetical protein